VQTVTTPPASTDSSRSINGVREIKVRLATGHRHPGRVTGQPQRHRYACSQCGRRDGEALVAPLGGFGATGDFDDQAAFAHPLRVGRAPGRLPAQALRAGSTRRLPAPALGAADKMANMLEPLLITLLVVVSLAIGWFSVYVIYKLFKGQA
jgi:hypothetical protein